MIGIGYCYSEMEDLNGDVNSLAVKFSVFLFDFLVTLSSARCCATGPDLAGGGPGAQLTWGH